VVNWTRLLTHTSHQKTMGQGSRTMDISARPTFRPPNGKRRPRTRFFCAVRRPAREHRADLLQLSHKSHHLTAWCWGHGAYPGCTGAPTKCNPSRLLNGAVSLHTIKKRCSTWRAAGAEQSAGMLSAHHCRSTAFVLQPAAGGWRRCCESSQTSAPSCLSMRGTRFSPTRRAVARGNRTAMIAARANSN